MKAKREGLTKDEEAAKAQLAYEVASKKWHEDQAKGDLKDAVLALQHEVSAETQEAIDQRLLEVQGE